MAMHELTIRNPHKQKADYIPVWIKIFWKTFINPTLGNPHHQVIIPETKLHSAWILGAQPSNYSIKNLLKERAGRTIRIVSMLTHPEQIIINQNPSIKITRTPWHDHSTLNLITGKNQTVKKMIALQKNLYDDFIKKPTEEIFYCHCMAGKARSFVETMAFIFFYTDKKELFDFKNWPKEIIKKTPEDLQKRLRDNPSFSDIAEFVKLHRPQVKSLLKMDCDQAGLLGLMMLNKLANNPEIIENRDEARCYKDAQNIGLMLEAPLDLKFRDSEDRKQQEENLIKVHAAFQKRGINLLMAMIIPIYENIDPANYQNDFAKNLKKLPASQQARFAILNKESSPGSPFSR